MSSKYSRTIENLNDNTSHGIILNNIKSGSTILECGSSSGYMTRYIKEKLHADVCIVEMNKEDYEEARIYASDGICADLDENLWLDYYAEKKFDYILFADVLEHLRNPQDVLKRAVDLLKDDGIVITSIPNIAHNDILINLLNNHWDYMPLGILDSTHIHFWAEKNLQELFTRAGLSVTKKDYAILSAYCTEQRNKDKINDLMPAIYTICQQKYGDVYQFVYFSQKIEYVEKKGLVCKDYYEQRHNDYCVQPKLCIDYENENNRNLQLAEEKSKIIKNNAVTIETQMKIIKKQIDQLQTKSKYIDSLLFDKQNLVNKMDNLNLQLRNKTGHINLLLESDRELHNIKNSRSWKLANKIAKITRAILPVGSKRRLIAKVIFKFLKSPILFIKKANIKRIKNFFKILKQEGVSAVSKRIDECLISLKNESNEIKVIDVIKNPIKTLYDYEKISFDTFEDVQVSIIIPVYNEFDYTYNCLKTIKNNSGNINYEIIIADDCSDDLTMDIEKVISGIKVIRNIENMRFLKNCNNAAKFARGKFILFLNNDTQVQKNWLLPLIDLFEKDKQIGLVGSKLVYPDGRLQEAGGIFWNDASAWNYGNKSDPNLSEFNYVKEVDYISGASILISKKLWNEIGGFDERFSPAYYEDSDLAFEVRKHGYKVMYQPLSVVVHFEGISNGTDLNSGQKSYQISNQKKFYDKWKDVLEKENFKNAENLFVARDRTRNKKTIVFIDHYVPTFDKDAGSKTVYQYIKLFVEHGFNVKLIGDNFYQAQPYSTIFQQMGVEVLYGTYYENNWKKWIKDNCKYFDFFFLNRPHISLKYVDFIRENTSAKIMYYGHDLHFLREYREYELTGDILCKENFKVWKQKELSLMKKVDYVYYPSIVEKNAIKEIDKNINVKVIPAYIFDGIKYSGYETAKRKDLIFIGGFSHKPNLDGVFWFVDKIFPKVKKIISDIKIYILGSNVPEKLKNISDESIIVHGFVTDEQLNEFYSNCRISVVPLRYGAGIKGKVIEAMKNGVPVVTTSIGAEGIIGAENILSIEDDETKFADAIINLYNNYEKLEEISKKSFDYIVDNFSSKSVLQIIKEDFNIS